MAVAARSADPLSQSDPDELDRAHDPRRTQSAGPSHDRGGGLSDVAVDPVVDRRLDARRAGAGQRSRSHVPVSAIRFSRSTTINTPMSVTAPPASIRAVSWSCSNVTPKKMPNSGD